MHAFMSAILLKAAKSTLGSTQRQVELMRRRTSKKGTQTEANKSRNEEVLQLMMGVK